MRTIACVIVALAVALPLRAQRPARQERFSADSTVGVSVQGIAFVASAILPGAGQFYLKADRWVPFVAVEGWAWLKQIQHHRDGSRLAKQYRDLAWNVARRITTSARKDSAFTYYEAIGHYEASGLFDSEPLIAGLQPELDETTFNGVQWKRARALAGGGAPVPGTPEYENALAYYRANAIPDDYIWSWGSNRLEREQFQETITRSDDAFRASTRMVGVILANHVVSAVDALVLARIKLLKEQGVRIGTTLEPGGSSEVWTATIHIPLGGAERARNSRSNR